MQNRRNDADAALDGLDLLV